MMIYKTRYQASKDRQRDERIVKVCGGYVLMGPRDYRAFRGQR